MTLVAFGAAIVFGARLGILPALVAVPGVALNLVLVVVLSRLAAWLFGALSRSRTGGVASALVTAAMLTIASSGWIVLVALEAVLDTGFSPTFSTVVRALPSSWALVAVDASARSDWLLAVAALAGLAVLVALLVELWTRSLGPPRWARAVVRGAPAARASVAATSTTGAVVRKELLSWSRDPVRIQSIVVAPVFAALTCLVPLSFDSTAFLAFMGALTALMGAVTSASLYGQDGTSLWLTLVTSGGERADVRGRQLAWLAIFAPATMVLAAVGIVAGGDAELVPWALAATAALIGGGAGLLPLISLDQLVPGPDPREHRDAPLDHGNLTGQAFVMMLLTAATALPALGLLIAGLSWIGVAAGVLTGVLAYVYFGRAAHRMLARRGPELLFLMRAGTEHVGEAIQGAQVLAAMPRSRRRLLSASVLVGCIALFPQALVPTLMKLSGDVAQVWFLALYLPEAWQWPMIALMYTLGTAALFVAWRTYTAQQRR